MNFAEFSEHYERDILVLRKRATINTISGHLDKMRASFSPCSLTELPYTKVQSFFSELASKYSPKTVRNIHTTYTTVMNQAMRERLISDFPKPVLPKVGRVEQPWVTLDQMRAAIKKAGELTPFVALLCETGLRIGEALGLRDSDLNTDNRTLVVRRSIYTGQEQEPKSNAAYRTLSVSEQLVSMVARRDGYLFPTSRGTPQWPQELRRRLDFLLGKPIGFHEYRRGSASLYACKVNMPEKILAYRMGHVCQGLSLGVYAKYEQNDDRPYVEKAAKLLYEGL